MGTGMLERLQKIIAAAGVASRRRAEELLEKELAQDVARLFFDHDPKNFGGGVSTFR